MGIAWLLTLAALCGVCAGAFWSRDSRVSGHVAAAGGGLLFGISFFWLLPEIATTSGRPAALLMIAGIAGTLALFDRTLAHQGHSLGQGIVWPILLATAMHSILDGWSLRLLSGESFTHVTVSIGLILHKVPEGVALGWIGRRALRSASRAFMAGSAAELFTLVGAFAEPKLNASGAEHFGLWWTAGVLSLVAGGFLFVSLHAIIPVRRNRNAMATFLVTMLLTGALSLLKSNGL